MKSIRHSRNYRYKKTKRKNDKQKNNNQNKGIDDSVESRLKYTKKMKFPKITKAFISKLLTDSNINIPCKKCPVYIMCKNKIKEHLDFKRHQYHVLAISQSLISSYLLKDMTELYRSFIRDCPYIEEFDRHVNEEFPYYNLTHIKRLLLKNIFNINF